jgi:hypothetical protein
MFHRVQNNAALHNPEELAPDTTIVFCNASSTTANMGPDPYRGPRTIS